MTSIDGQKIAEALERIADALERAYPEYEYIREREDLIAQHQGWELVGRSTLSDSLLVYRRRRPYIPPFRPLNLQCTRNDKTS